jgi:hypothetical protein
LPKIPEIPCYILNIGECTDEQRDRYFEGTAIVEDYFITDFGNGTCCPNPVRSCHAMHDGQNSISTEHESHFGTSRDAMTSAAMLIKISFLILTTCGLILAEILRGKRNWAVKE